jgi:hypothetical protein
MNAVSGKTVVVVLLAVFSVPVIFMILAIIWAFWPGS